MLEQKDQHTLRLKTFWHSGQTSTDSPSGSGGVTPVPAAAPVLVGVARGAAAGLCCAAPSGGSTAAPGDALVLLVTGLVGVMTCATRCTS